MPGRLLNPGGRLVSVLARCCPDEGEVQFDEAFRSVTLTMRVDPDALGPCPRRFAACDHRRGVGLPCVPITGLIWVVWTGLHRLPCKDV